MEIIRIPANKSLRKQRVAAYCRVSTLKEEQEDSLELQEQYYCNLIASRSDWEFVKVYADARSGLSAEKRPQFVKMIKDALNGKIDRILCKSVSRFSRNVVECRRYIDMLKTIDVAVEFEKENIKTDAPNSTFFLSLMSVVAENESISISENVKLGYSYRYNRGEFNVGNNQIFGYDTVDGKLVPNEDAPIVKHIFEEYAAGKSIKDIKKSLLENGVSASRKSRISSFASIRYILNNETYKGDRLLWKTPPRNLFTKQLDLSQTRDSIYIVDDHEPIVDLDTWDKVQARFNERKELGKKLGHVVRRSNPLYGKFFCAKCGAPMMRSTYSMRNKEKYKVWICRNRYYARKDEVRCDMDVIKEVELFKIVAKKLKWKSFDEEKFLEEVDRVDVNGKKVTVTMKMKETEEWS